MRAGVFLNNILPNFERRSSGQNGRKPLSFPIPPPLIYSEVLKNYPDGKAVCCSAASYSSKEQPVQLLGQTPAASFLQVYLSLWQNYSRRMLLRERDTSLCTSHVPASSGWEGGESISSSSGGHGFSSSFFTYSVMN